MDPFQKFSEKFPERFVEIPEKSDSSIPILTKFPKIQKAEIPLIFQLN